MTTFDRVIFGETEETFNLTNGGTLKTIYCASLHGGTCPGCRGANDGPGAAIIHSDDAGNTVYPSPLLTGISSWGHKRCMDGLFAQLISKLAIDNQVKTTAASGTRDELMADLKRYGRLTEVTYNPTGPRSERYTWRSTTV